MTLTKINKAMDVIKLDNCTVDVLSIDNYSITNNGVTGNANQIKLVKAVNGAFVGTLQLDNIVCVDKNNVPLQFTYADIMSVNNIDMSKCRTMNVDTTYLKINGLLFYGYVNGMIDTATVNLANIVPSSGVTVNTITPLITSNNLKLYVDIYYNHDGVSGDKTILDLTNFKFLLEFGSVSTLKNSASAIQSLVFYDTSNKTIKLASPLITNGTTPTVGTYRMIFQILIPIKA